MICTRQLKIEQDCQRFPIFAQVFPLLALICSLIGAHRAADFARISPRHVADESIALGKDKRPEPFRYRPSGTYFARFKIGDKPIRQSLETTVFSVAKQRLPEKIREYRSRHESAT